MNVRTSTGPFGPRTLNNALVIARFHVVGQRHTLHLAIERTTDDRVYLLALDKKPVAEVIAVVTIDGTGAYAGHRSGDCYLNEDQITACARMAGWKILTYRTRRRDEPARVSTRT
jgi:hypothetical protein